MIEADKLLQKWSCYSIENRMYIEKIFNGSNRYDMMLNVEVMQKQAKIYILERGVTIYEYRTERKEILIEVLLGNKCPNSYFMNRSLCSLNSISL